MLCIAIKSKGRIGANLLFTNESTNFLIALEYIEKMLNNYNKKLVSSGFDGEILETKMLVDGYMNYVKFMPKIKIAPKTEEYLKKAYGSITFCKSYTDAPVILNVEAEEVISAMTKSSYHIIVDMEQKIISHDLIESKDNKSDYIKRYEDIYNTKPSFNILNAKINNFHFYDIDEVKRFMGLNMQRYFLDEERDTVYFIDNNTIEPTPT